MLYRTYDTTDPSDIDNIVSLVHDCRFRSSEILVQGGKVDIPFTLVDFSRKIHTDSRRFFWRMAVAPLLRAHLVVQTVDHCEIQDAARIEEYSFRTIRYDPSTGTMIIEAGVPFKLVIRVRSFHLAVIVTDEGLGTWTGVSRGRVPPPVWGEMVWGEMDRPVGDKPRLG